MVRLAHEEPQVQVARLAHEEPRLAHERSDTSNTHIG